MKTQDLMDLLYKFVVWTIVAPYRFLHFYAIRLLGNTVKMLIINKFSSVGINMVDEDGIEIEKEKKRKKKIKSKNMPLILRTKTNVPDVTMTIHDQQEFFERLCNDRSLGLGETYMMGVWDCENLADLFERICGGELFNFLLNPMDKLVHYLRYELFNLQTAARAYQVANEHYDLGDPLFESFLDPAMVYTCAYWKNAKNLAEAQQHKLDLVARKLKLKPGMRVLDLGCGWGGLSEFLARNYKVNVVAVNIAKAGAKATAKRCQGLPVDVRCCDYREINEKFDRVVAVGLMEHVGEHNYKSFFEVANRCLDDNGIFLVHTIGVDNSRIVRIEPFFSKYIFPNGYLPHASDFPKHANGQFTIEDWHNFGPDYTKTLLAWEQNFVRNWQTIQHHFKQPTQFYRMWRYYLLMSAGGFASRKYQLWQVVLTKNGFHGGYQSER